jgi:hypothetical protein
MMDYPVLVFSVTLITLWLAGRIGTRLSGREGKLDEDLRTDLGVILTAALTLLGLIIGFTFSMAIVRYDQRKQCEAVEANAIGTEYARAGLLASPEAQTVREMLKAYLHQRVLFYRTRDANRLQQISAATAELQSGLWSAVQDHVSNYPPATAMLVISGMNDVLNSQAYTQAAWWNRIPIAAWALMVAIAICCDSLAGYTERSHVRGKRVLVLPLLVSISFFLIADIDSPRGGVIRVHPQNLESLLHSL